MIVALSLLEHAASDPPSLALRHIRGHAAGETAITQRRNGPFQLIMSNHIPHAGGSSASSMPPREESAHHMQLIGIQRTGSPGKGMVENTFAGPGSQHTHFYIWFPTIPL